MGSSWCSREKRHRDGHDDSSGIAIRERNRDRTVPCVVPVLPDSVPEEQAQQDDSSGEEEEEDATTLSHQMPLHTAPNVYKNSRSESNNNNMTTAAMLAVLSDMMLLPPTFGSTSTPAPVIISSPCPPGGRDSMSFPEAVPYRSDSLSGSGSPIHKRVSIGSSGRTSIGSDAMAGGPLKTSSVRGGSSVASLIRNNAAERSNCSTTGNLDTTMSDLASTTVADPALIPMTSGRRTGSTSGGDFSGANMSELCSSQLCASVLARCEMSNGSGGMQEQPPSPPMATTSQL